MLLFGGGLLPEKIMTHSSSGGDAAAALCETPPFAQSGSTCASTLLAGSCLQLVAKLLNYTKNPQAELYNRVFSKQDRQLIKAMKLETFIKSEKRYATEAMSLLESYMNKNPKLSDIRNVLGDDQACDKFKRWSIVKNNYREMGSVDKRSSSFLPKASFKRSKGSLGFS